MLSFISSLPYFVSFAKRRRSLSVGCCCDGSQRNHNASLLSFSSVAPRPNAVAEPVRLSFPLNDSSHSPPHQIVVYSNDTDIAASSPACSTQELCAKMVQLRRKKLALLAEDLLHRVYCSNPDVSTHLMYRLSSLATALMAVRTEQNDDALRTELRACLWELREELDPFDPPETVRSSLEIVRSGLLDIPPLFFASPKADASSSDDEVCKVAEGSASVDAISGIAEMNSACDDASLRSEMHHLLFENSLLEELRSLRLLEREVSRAVATHYPDLCFEERQRLYYSAACELGFDEYRVRSKRQVADAAESLEKALLHEITARTKSCHAELVDSVREGLRCLKFALLQSLKSDLARKQPAGEAMLLRPRVVDIPNFAIVSSNLLRGGQPSTYGVRWLQKCGVSLVIDLRGSDRGNQWSSPDFEDIHPAPDDGSLNGGSFLPRGYVSAQSNHDVMLQRRPKGARYGWHPRLRVRNLAIEDFDVPTDQQVQEFVRLVDEVSRENSVVFVHCKAGIGRTGTLVACWRICMGETVEGALSKERLYSTYGGGLRQESFVRDFAARHTSRI